MQNLDKSLRGTLLCLSSIVPLPSELPRKVATTVAATFRPKGRETLSQSNKEISSKAKNRSQKSSVESPSQSSKYLSHGTLSGASSLSLTTIILGRAGRVNQIDAARSCKSRRFHFVNGIAFIQAALSSGASRVSPNLLSCV